MGYELCYHRLVQQTTARCTQLELIGDYVRAHFVSALQLAPGQLALARLAGTFDPYLSQPLFPALIAAAGFAVDLAPEAALLRFIFPGSILDVLGPIGAAVPEGPPRSRVLLIADANPAPLLPFAARAIEAGGTATLLLASRYPLDALRPEIELRIGDLPALLAEFAPAADLVFIHTQPNLHQALAQCLRDARIFSAAESVRALIAGPLPCGVGACGACVVHTARGWRLACTEGPFFSLLDLHK